MIWVMNLKNPDRKSEKAESWSLFVREHFPSHNQCISQNSLQNIRARVMLLFENRPFHEDQPHKFRLTY